RVGRAVHRRDLGLERREIAVQADRGLARGHLLERGPDRVDLDELVLADRPDARAAERLRLDEAEQLEVAERLPDRRLARPELLRDPRLDEPVPRRVLAAQDPLEDQLLDLLAQDDARDGAHRSTSTTPL